MQVIDLVSDDEDTPLPPHLVIETPQKPVKFKALPVSLLSELDQLMARLEQRPVAPAAEPITKKPGQKPVSIDIDDPIEETIVIVLYLGPSIRQNSDQGRLLQGTDLVGVRYIR